MKHVFIVNPVSGRADASGELVPRIIRAAAGMGLDHKVEMTKAPRHAMELAQKYAAEGPVRLYACGGDGTLNEVFAGAWPFTGAEVACVPCGSGNDFVRNYGRAEQFLDLEAQMRGEAVTIDLIRTDLGSGVAAAICSAGLDAQVAYGIPKFRRIPLCGGHMAYNLSILQQLCGHLGCRLRVEAGSEVFEDEYLMVAVCNGVAYGGGFMAAPEAKLDDGLLDVVLVKKVGLVRIAQVIGMYKAGKHIENGRVRADVADIIRLVRTPKVRLTALGDKPVILNVDGECAPGRALSAQVLPGAARFVLPQGVYAAQKKRAARV